MSGDMVEVVIDSIKVGLMSQNRVVILRELDEERYLAIWIDPYMAEQITYALQSVQAARPMTHDLMKSILLSLNARVARVEVTSLRKDIFYGNIVLEVNGEYIDIDSRPSDALALAVRTNVPILVSREVMEQNGIVPESDIEEIDKVDEVSQSSPAVQTDGEASEDRLSVFDDFLENLDLDEEDQKGDKDN
jgi:bifunctional DNase/RNase